MPAAPAMNSGLPDVAAYASLPVTRKSPPAPPVRVLARVRKATADPAFGAGSRNQHGPCRRSAGESCARSRRHQPAGPPDRCLGHPDAVRRSQAGHPRRARQRPAGRPRGGPPCRRQPRRGPSAHAGTGVQRCAPPSPRRQIQPDLDRQGAAHRHTRVAARHGAVPRPSAALGGLGPPAALGANRRARRRETARQAVLRVPQLRSRVGRVFQQRDDSGQRVRDLRGAGRLRLQRVSQDYRCRRWPRPAAVDDPGESPERAWRALRPAFRRRRGRPGTDESWCGGPLWGLEGRSSTQCRKAATPTS